MILGIGLSLSFWGIMVAAIVGTKNGMWPFIGLGITMAMAGGWLTSHSAIIESLVNL